VGYHQQANSAAGRAPRGCSGTQNNKGAVYHVGTVIQLEQAHYLATKLVAAARPSVFRSQVHLIAFWHYFGTTLVPEGVCHATMRRAGFALEFGQPRAAQRSLLHPEVLGIATACYHYYRAELP
jgi:hypothetical protein